MRFQLNVLQLFLNDFFVVHTLLSTLGLFEKNSIQTEVVILE